MKAMSAFDIVVVEHEFLALVPAAAVERTQSPSSSSVSRVAHDGNDINSEQLQLPIPFIRLRDLASFLCNRNSSRSHSQLVPCCCRRRRTCSNSTVLLNKQQRGEENDNNDDKQDRRKRCKRRRNNKTESPTAAAAAISRRTIASTATVPIQERMLNKVRGRCYSRPCQENRSFCIPNSNGSSSHQSVDICATDKEGTFLMATAAAAAAACNHDSDENNDRYHSCIVQLSGTSGYWIGDFCGIGGYQQVLWFPKVVVVADEHDDNDKDKFDSKMDIPSMQSPSDAKDDDAQSFKNPKWCLHTAKRILLDIVHQCALTDGVNVLLSATAAPSKNDSVLGRNDHHHQVTMVQQTRTPWSNCSRNIVLAPIVVTTTAQSGVLDQCQNNDVDNAAAAMQPLQSDDENDQGGGPQKCEPPKRTKPQPSLPSLWMETMTRAIELRLAKERKDYEKRVQAQQVKNHLLKQNRKAVQQLLGNPKGADDDHSTVQPLQIRYRPLSYRGSSSSSRKCIVLYMEVDLVGFAGTGAETTLYRLHVSCSPIMDTSSATTVDTETTHSTDVSVKTRSGIVPNLQDGTCVTVVVIAEVSNVVLVEETVGRDIDISPLALSVEAHWVVDAAANRKQTTKRRASRMAVLPLSLESLLLPQHEWTCLNCKDPAEVDCSATGGVPTTRRRRRRLAQILSSSAIYDCRKPHRILIDVSYCSTSFDSKKWAKLFNTMLEGTGHCIVLCENKGGNGGDDTLSILLFPFQSEDVPGLATLVKKHLPDLVMVLDG